MAVYFARAATGEIKIGYSATPESRIAGLQTGNPYPLDLLAVEESWGLTEESSLHGLFASDRLQGEWFKPSPALLGLITGLNFMGKAKPTLFLGPKASLYHDRTGKAIFTLAQWKGFQALDQINDSHDRSPHFVDLRFDDTLFTTTGEAVWCCTCACALFEEVNSEPGNWVYVNHLWVGDLLIQHWGNLATEVMTSAQHYRRWMARRKAEGPYENQTEKDFQLELNRIKGQLAESEELEQQRGSEFPRRTPPA